MIAHALQARPIETLLRETLCPVCASPVALWRTKQTTVGRFAIDRCKACDYAFVNPRPTLEFLMQFYATSGHSRDGQDVGDTLESVMERERVFPNSIVDAGRMIGTIRRLLTPGPEVAPRLLDVGCGHGFYSREALASGFTVTAIELAATERAIATRMTGLQPLEVPFEDFDAPAGSFDALLMSQILEHALDVNQWAERAGALLRVGGVLAIALPNFGSLLRRLLRENDPFVTPPAHLNYFDDHNLALLLQRHGFAVREVQWVSRIPPSAWKKRLARFGDTAAKVAGATAAIGLRVVDGARMGMMLNVYATRER